MVHHSSYVAYMANMQTVPFFRWDFQHIRISLPWLLVVGFFFFFPSWVIEALPQKTMIDDIFKGLKKHRLFLKLCHCLHKGRRRNYLNSTVCSGPQQGSSEADAEIRVHSAFAPTPHTKGLVGAGTVWSLSEAQCSQTTMLGSYDCTLPPWEM